VVHVALGVARVGLGGDLRDDALELGVVAGEPRDLDELGQRVGEVLAVGGAGDLEVVVLGRVPQLQHLEGAREVVVNLRGVLGVLALFEQLEEHQRGRERLLRAVLLHRLLQLRGLGAIGGLALFAIGEGLGALGGAGAEQVVFALQGRGAAGG
ncbi:MAG: hypothetical protein ACK559_27075, partial [bacterium]